MPQLPIGDKGPCEVTWDYDDTNLIITPYLGRVSFRIADTVTDIHEEGGGVAAWDAFFGGTVLEFEIPMARSTLAQLAQTIGYATLGTLVGTVLNLHNVAGFDMYAFSKTILLKPICNNVPNPDPRTWTLIHRCHPYRDIDLGFDRSGQRIHLVKFKVFPNRDTGYGDAGGGIFVGEGVPCPPETPLMSLKYEDPAWFIEYKSLCNYDEKLCIFDHGPGSAEGQVLYTTDGGVTWPQLFSRTSAQIGTINDKDANSLAAYNGSLFITRYQSTVTPPCPRVIEWDGANVNLHLQAPNWDNYMAYGLVVWDGNLWCVTDATPFIDDDRRVVYFYDGTFWIPIANYGGPTINWLPYNKNIHLPILDIRPRCTRLFVFKNELYLIATWYAGAKWSWQVWKFDATAYNNFTYVYDSDVFDDGNGLAAIIEFEGKVYIVGNEIDVANGNPSMNGRLYSSTDMATWAVEAELPNIGFPFGEELFRPASGACLIPSMDERFYLNCVNVTPGDNNTCIRYWNEGAGEFTLHQTIGTNPLTAGGGLRTFDDALYAGKYKEVYANVV